MIKREFGLFLLIGSVTVFIDYLTYRTLIWINLLDVDEAKSVGFVTGTVFAFFANRFWTFGHKRHAAGHAAGIVWRFVLLYAISLSTNVIINSLALSVFIAQPVSVQLAFVIATAVSAAINFVGMKAFVFKAATPRDLT